MPSIPQSLLWISLVVLWLFVLVPMLISKRDAVRRTSDVALATRVLNTGRGARLLKRRAPAAGHRSDPHWQPSDEDRDDEAEHESPGQSVVVAEADADEIVAESEYLDVDVIDEDSGALPVGVSARAPVEEPEPEQDDQTDELTLEFETEADEPEAEYEPEPWPPGSPGLATFDPPALQPPSQAALTAAIPGAPRLTSVPSARTPFRSLMNRTGREMP